MLTTAAYYLLARAEITRFLWSRYSPRVDRFMACAACTGFWYGLVVSCLGWAWQWEMLGLPARSYLTPPIVGLCSMIWTPVVSWIHLEAHTRLGGPEDDETDNARSDDADETKS